MDNYKADILPSTAPNSPSLQSIKQTNINFNNNLNEQQNIFGLPDFDAKPISYWIKLSFIIMLKIVLACIVGYLSWNCNKNMNILLRILVFFISIIFSEVYMIYYAIFRSLMGNKCF